MPKNPSSLSDPQVAMQATFDKLHTAQSTQALEQIRIETIGKKGILTEYFSTLKSLPEAEKKQLATSLNSLRKEFEEHFQAKLIELESKELESKLALDSRLGSLTFAIVITALLLYSSKRDSLIISLGSSSSFCICA